MTRGRILCYRRRWKKNETHSPPMPRLQEEGQAQRQWFACPPWMPKRTVQEEKGWFRRRNFTHKAEFWWEVYSESRHCSENFFTRRGKIRGARLKWWSLEHGDGWGGSDGCSRVQPSAASARSNELGEQAQHRNADEHHCSVLGVRETVDQTHCTIHEFSSESHEWSVTSDDVLRNEQLPAAILP